MTAPKRMNAPKRKNALKAPPMFPHTVTLYNVRKEFDKATFKDTTVNHITILRGVLVDASKAVNVRQSGLEGADAVNLYIPFDVEAISPDDLDAENPKIKPYIGPKEYWALPTEDVDRYWTLETAETTFFVKGVAVESEDATRQFIESKYEHVYSITKIDEKDFGSLQHWEIGAN